MTDESQPPQPKIWEIYEARSDSQITDPKQLWDMAVEYFVWCENNPHVEDKIFNTKETIRRTPAFKVRSYTFDGLFLHLGIIKSDWEELKENEAFKRVTESIESIIYEQQFTTGTAGFSHAGMVTRSLGLTEKKDVSTNLETEITVNIPKASSKVL